ncbi:MAG: hypothetical protein A2X18_10845 [Bacteroidetes bacterium GWF2_40_14]|nr:MAG: hypothetical protein A2X18_10845 [Bacteroidetes bacterium GWF2_40_14]
MNASNNGGSFGFVVLLGTIAVSILSGILAWNWIEPESFFGAIIFLIAWSLFSYIGYLVLGGIVALFGGLK